LWRCTSDPEGYVWLRGRSKDLIIRGGHNIDPLVIEGALLTHPAVMLAAAIGQPHRDKGEVPVVYVQLRPGTSAAESELLAHCQSEISERAAIPREVRILGAMPVTAVGKIFKPALRLDAVQRCVAAVRSCIQGADDIRIEVRDGGGAIAVVLKTGQTNSDCVERLRGELERYTFLVEVETPSAN
jgi:fatty-acyl-CoA synthase